MNDTKILRRTIAACNQRSKRVRFAAVGLALVVLGTSAVGFAEAANAEYPADGGAGSAKPHQITCYLHQDKKNTFKRTVDPPNSFEVPGDSANIYYSGTQIWFRWNFMNIRQGPKVKVPERYKWDKLKFKMVVGPKYGDLRCKF